MKTDLVQVQAVRRRQARRRVRDDVSWISLMSALAVSAYLLITFLIEPGSEHRAALHTFTVISIGYGHLLSGLYGHRQATSRMAGARTLSLVTGLGLAYGIYTHAVAQWPLLPVALLAISAWHTVENDRAMRHGGLMQRGGLLPVSRSPRAWGTDLLLASSASALAIGLPRVTPSVGIGDVVVVFSLYHLISWLLYSMARAQRRGRFSEGLRRLAVLHAVPFAACVAARYADTHAWQGPAPLEYVQTQLLSPATYLFWSAAHVIQTAWRRGIARHPANQARA